MTTQAYPRAVSFSSPIAKSKSDRWSDKIFSDRLTINTYDDSNPISEKSQWPTEKIREKTPIMADITISCFGTNVRLFGI